MHHAIGDERITYHTPKRKSCEDTGLHYNYEFLCGTERRTVTVTEVFVPSKEE